MSQSLSPLRQLQQRILSGEVDPTQIAAESLAHSNTNASHNVYIAQDESDLIAQAKSLAALDPTQRPSLFAVPISLKDCFDLRGYTTTCASRFYANANAPAIEDSWIAAQLKKAGAIITGKAHLHMLAYGITGQNPDYGDCLQPVNPALLTGGSSSGAVASVQEGSALAAIGTDTGGSVRVPAALCGLAGFRASVDLGSRIAADNEVIWAGGVHLAPSFDTLGILFRDLGDGPALAQAIFNLPAATPIKIPRIAIVTAEFLSDAEPGVIAAYNTQQQSLVNSGATLHPIDTSWWSDAQDILAPIQANEAAAIQRALLFTANPATTFSVFEKAVADRLAWGESQTPEHIASLRSRHAAFRQKMDDLLSEYDLLLMPCAPVTQLRADADHSNTRTRLLRYTSPVSLAGMPAVTIPSRQYPGAGLQLAASRGRDTALLEYAASLLE